MINKADIQLSNFKYIYFLGIGGIGMSALAKYFLLEGCQVAGYDKTTTAITEQLEKDGASIHFEDEVKNIPSAFLNIDDTLIIRTPAVPAKHTEWLFFQEKNFTILKRAEILGVLTRNYKGLAVAGTHGKTTTSTLLAHMLNESRLNCNAFLGGISTNFDTNFIANKNAEYTVIEADEFDRSFLQLSPFASIITAVDADHLDIYGSEENFRVGFEEYAKLIQPQGLLVQRYGINLSSPAKTITYGVNEINADFNAYNLRYENEVFLMDMKSQNLELKDLELGVPGIHNAENALSCIALLDWLGVKHEIIRSSLKSFLGVKRRFEYHIKTDDLVYIDDYAHHPTEIKALMDSVHLLYPNKKIVGLFQPHLFTRTRDFLEDFSKQLSRLDECILLPIYPAREEPIEGVTSDALLESITADKKSLLSPTSAIDYLSKQKDCIILTIGAGDIDRVIQPLKTKLQKG